MHICTSRLIIVPSFSQRMIYVPLGVVIEAFKRNERNFPISVLSERMIGTIDGSQSHMGTKHPFLVDDFVTVEFFVGFRLWIDQ